MTETLPVGWGCMPGVLDLHIVPGFEGRGYSEDGGGEQGAEEGKRRDPSVSHEQWRSSSTNVQLGSLEGKADVQSFYLGALEL